MNFKFSYLIFLYELYSHLCATILQDLAEFTFAVLFHLALFIFILQHFICSHLFRCKKLHQKVSEKILKGEAVYCK